MSPDQSWAPKRDVFLRRSLMIGVATFTLFAGAGLVAALMLDLPFVWTLPVAALLTLGFFVEDVLRWRSCKYDRWLMSEGHLLHEDKDGTASIPLGDIRRVTTSFGSRVVVELLSGQRITLRYLPFPAETAAHIRSRIFHPG